MPMNLGLATQRRDEDGVLARQREYGIQWWTVISASEQVAYVETRNGNYVTGSLPSGGTETVFDLGILRKVNDLDHAINWFNRYYSEPRR